MHPRGVPVLPRDGLRAGRWGRPSRPGRCVESVRQSHGVDGVTQQGRGRPLDRRLGTATQIESVRVGDVLLEPATYGRRRGDPEARLIGQQWLPNVGEIVVTYQAGIDISLFPSVKQWMLLAAGWIYEQPEMYTVAAAVTALPAEYVDGLLAPIKCLPRF